jgi:SCY1-like protein 2
MAVLDVFKEINKVADAEYLAMDVLPLLWTFSLGPLLNLQQFQAFMALIHALSTRIEQEHTRKLQDLSSTNPAAASRNDFMSFGGPVGSPNGLDDTMTGDGGAFEALVLGKQSADSSTQNALDPWSTHQSSASSQLPTRTQAQQADPTPAFSWSTPAPPPPPRSNNTASQPVTPGSSLNAFAALQPQSQFTSSFSQPLQPSNTLQHSSSSASNVSANPWAPSTTQTPSNLWTTNSTQSSVWASGQPQRTTSNPSFGQTQHPNTSSQSAFTIAPPPTSPYSSFGIAPPPAMGAPKPNYSNTSGGLNSLGAVQKQQPPTAQKQGMDKYESLL